MIPSQSVAALPARDEVAENPGLAQLDLRSVDSSRLRVLASLLDVPPRLRIGPDETVLVPDLDVLEDVVRAGVDSLQIAVADVGAEPAWLRSAAQRARGEAVLPAAPFRSAERLLVVVPTYDERENLERLVVQIERHIACDVLVVDDASPDGTGEIAEQLAESRPWLHVLHRSGKQGLGRAYAAGFRWGLERGYDRLFEMDADFSHAPHDLPRLAHAARDAELVIGSRYVQGGDTSGWSRWRRLVSRFGNLYARLWLGLDLRDMTAGFRCYDARLLERIDLGAILADGYAFQIEMAWRVHRAGGRIREIPVRFVDRDAGRSKMSRRIALEAMRTVPRLRLGHGPRRGDSTTTRPE